ncbi:hypothetical protein BN844_1128 [Pseudomonas sp. SHC52]|nr:hypothetical protein BN844_1128 [Pseudomonas sp. SHC52]
MSDVGQCCRLDEPHVPRSKYAHVHSGVPRRSFLCNSDETV